MNPTNKKFVPYTAEDKKELTKSKKSAPSAPSAPKVSLKSSMQRRLQK